MVLVRLTGWTKKDAIYAAATAFAGLVVVFLMAANFGLVPNPFGPEAPDLLTAPEVPALTATSAQIPAPDETTTTIGESPRGVPSVETMPDPDAPVTTPLSADPRVAFTTDDGTVMLRLTEQAVVEGTAAHADRVIVTFEPALGAPSVAQAALDCTSPARCTWSVPAPSILGSFTVSAQAFSSDGRGAVAEPISVTVVDASLNTGNGGLLSGGGGTEDSGPVEELLSDTGNAVGGVVEGVTGVLGL